MKSVKKEVSFRRKLMTAVLSVTLPLIALLLFSNLYSTQAFNSKIADSNCVRWITGRGAWRSNSTL